MSQRPLLTYSPLTGTIYILTRYKKKGTAVVASAKHEVPKEEFLSVLKQFEGDYNIVRPAAPEDTL